MTGTGVPCIVSLLFDLSVCLCRPECLSVTGLRFLTVLCGTVQYCTVNSVVRTHSRSRSLARRDTLLPEFHRQVRRIAVLAVGQSRWNRTGGASSCRMTDHSSDRIALAWLALLVHLLPPSIAYATHHGYGLFLFGQPPDIVLRQVSLVLVVGLGTAVGAVAASRAVARQKVRHIAQPAERRQLARRADELLDAQHGHFWWARP